MVTKIAIDFLTFWCQARGGAVVPAHSDIRLERLESMSSRVIYSAWDDQDRLVMTYVGTDLVDAFGVDTKGMDQMSFSHPKELEMSRLSLGLIGEFPCGLRATITLRGEAITPREFECIYLPVSHEGRNSHILELVNPLAFDYQSGDEDGAMQALRYSNRVFIDIGAGTPVTEGTLAPYGICTLEDLMPN